MNDLTKILKQKPLIVKADTRTLYDIGQEKGEPFSDTLDRAVKNLDGYGVKNFWRMLQSCFKAKG